MVRPPRLSFRGVKRGAGRAHYDQPMTADPPPPSLKDLEVRLASLRGRTGLEKDGTKDGHGGESAASSSAMGLAVRAGVELAAGLAVGGGIGWFLDGWLNTRPFLMLLFFVLGAAAGMLNVVRTARAINAPEQDGNKS